MIRTGYILSQIKGLVGWHKPSDSFPYTEFPETQYLYESQSGYRVDDLSELIRVENLDKVRAEDQDIELFLERIFSQAANDVLNDYYLASQVNSYAKTIIPSQTFYLGVGNAGNVITKSDRFVGQRLQIKGSDSISVLIRRIGFQFTGNESFNLYIYNDIDAQPIYTIPVNYDTVNNLKWIDINDENGQPIYLNSRQSQYYYIGYFESNIASNAIYRRYDGLPCNCTSSINYLNHYVSSFPFSMPGDSFTGTEMNEYDGVDAVYNFGINIETSVFCDVSGMITSNLFLFAQALQKKLGIRSLERIYQTPELTNFSMGAAKKDAFMLAEKLEAEYKEGIQSIQIELSGMDSVCVPKNKKGMYMSNLAR